MAYSDFSSAGSLDRLLHWSGFHHAGRLSATTGVLSARIASPHAGLEADA